MSNTAAPMSRQALPIGQTQDPTRALIPNKAMAPLPLPGNTWGLESFIPTANSPNSVVKPNTSPDYTGYLKYQDETRRFPRREMLTW